MQNVSDLVEAYGKAHPLDNRGTRRAARTAKGKP